MIKRLGAAIAAMCLVATSSYANTTLLNYSNPTTAPFKKNGFYVGAGVGSTFLNYHAVISQPNPIINVPIYGHGFLGNVQAGYQLHCNCLTLAFDGFFNVTSQRTRPYTIYGPDGNFRNMQFVNDWNAGFSLLPGYLLNDYLNAYLRLGYINSHYAITTKGSGSNQFLKNLPGAQIGLGGEVWFPMLKNFSVRGEFDSIIAPSWHKIGNFASSNGQQNNANVNINNNLFQINFIYHIV